MGVHRVHVGRGRKRDMSGKKTMVLIPKVVWKRKKRGTIGEQRKPESCLTRNRETSQISRRSDQRRGQERDHRTDTGIGPERERGPECATDPGTEKDNGADHRRGSRGKDLGRDKLHQRGGKLTTNEGTAINEMG